MVFAKTAIPLFIILLFSQYFFALKDIYHIKQQSVAREKMVSEQKAQGQKDIVITENQLKYTTNIPRRQELLPDTAASQNWAFSIYHGIRSVRVEYK
jgi:hypothetical protein